MLTTICRTRALAALTAAAVLLTCALPAAAQSRRPQRKAQPPAATQPATPAQPGATVPDLQPSPFIKRVRPHRWTLTTSIFIGAQQWLEAQDDALLPKHDTWEFDAATLVFPVLGETASSILEVRGPTSGEIPAVAGKVELGDRVLTNKVEILTQGIGGGPLPSGTWRGQWQIEPSPEGAYVTRELEFDVTTSQVCYETQFDERGAGAVDWPTGPWPPEAAATFLPEMFVDFDMEGQAYDQRPIADLVQRWTEGQDPRKVKPVVLAKFLAGQVLEHVQINGEGLTHDKTGMWQGFATPGAAIAAATGEGTEIDLPCLLVAVYRAVGLPSRVVVGYDEESEGKQIYLKKKGGSGALRVWVEFALYDEAKNTFGWVPVDITKLRKTQSRVPPNFLSSPTKYFGTHDELDRVVPIGFHFHPPTTVRSYNAPALWGWFVTPTPPYRAVQRVQFNIGTTPSGGSDESRLPAKYIDR